MYNYKNDIICKFVPNDYTNQEAIENVLKYAVRKDKADIVSTQNCPKRINSCIQQFYDLQKIYNFPNAFQNRIIHFIIAPSNRYFGIQNLEYIIQLLKTEWEPLQFLCSIHEDTNHPHIHVVINPICFSNGQQIDAKALFENLGNLISHHGYIAHME